MAQGGHAPVHRTCALLGIKRTCRLHCGVSAYDPKRTFRSSKRTPKHEKGACADQRKTNSVIPRYWLVQIEDRETRKYKKGYYLLHRLELRRAVDGAAVSISRDRQAIFYKGNEPCAMSAFDPKRTSADHLFAVVPNISGEFPFARDLLPHYKIFS